MTPFNNVLLTTAPSENQIIFTVEDYTVEVCRTKASMNTAFRLRYRAYLGVEAITENTEELLFDDYDYDPNTFIHLVWYQGKPVATVRGCIYAQHYDWVKTEGIKYFPTDVANQLGEQTHILESNRYAVDPEFQGRKSLFAQMLMFRAHALNARAHNCTQIITAVRSKHTLFYRRFLGMEKVSTKSKFIPWANAYVELLSTTTENCLHIAIKRGMPDIDPAGVCHYAKCAGIKRIKSASCIAA